MPTGYTASLKDRGYDVKKWLTEDVVRAFGICVMFRDDGKMDEKKILEELSKECTYHAEETAAAEKKLKEAKNTSDKSWEIKAKKLYNDGCEEYEERLLKKNKTTKIWDNVTRELIQIKARVDTEVNGNIVDFAIEQWNLVEDEHKKVYLPKPTERTGESYKKLMIEGAEHDLAYHVDGQRKDEARKQERLEAYRDLLKFIEVIKEIKL